MEPPKSFNTSEVKDEKVKVLKAVRKLDNKYLDGNVVFGQYSDKTRSYLSEPGVAPGSMTETYIALKLMIENERWKGTPFYLRTGKYLARKASEVVIYFKNTAAKTFPAYPVKDNVLVVRLQPDEGIYLRFNIKKPGNVFDIQDVSMDFCHECIFGINTPEAYEKLIYDVTLGDPSLFTRWDEVEASWKIIDPVSKYKKNVRPAFYLPGTWGPEESEKIMKAGGHRWREPL